LAAGREKIGVFFDGLAGDLFEIFHTDGVPENRKP
jgi:hypothetical protein